MSDAPITILIVDDDPAAREILGHTLARVDGIAASYAESLAGAARALESGGVDVVFLDAYLGDSAGISTITAITSRYAQPVVVVSGEADRDFITRAIVEGGASGYVVKPFDAKEIRTAALVAIAIAEKHQRRRERKREIAKPHLEKIEQIILTHQLSMEDGPNGQ